ncbi:MAG: hypothetical protein LBE31_04785 [Deltaproteobacteria bacterium]|jgi:hypothetical protein|nr:hypothetical protein [Deltaproteobacteria bacterium]
MSHEPKSNLYDPQTAKAPSWTDGEAKGGPGSTPGGPPWSPPVPQGFLGRFLESQASGNGPKVWRLIFFMALALVVILSLMVPNHHPHFVYDAKPFFWPAFGLVAGLVLVFLVKKVIQPIIKKPEDYYGDL